jgi:DNA polymerase III subunit delta'
MYMLEFDWQVIGQKNVLKFLEQGLINRSFGHAYLFCGPKSIGKTTIAKRLIKFLICDNYQKYQANADVENLKVSCDDCANCRQFEKGLYPGYYILERAVDDKTGKRKQNITIQQIRDLHEQIQHRSFANSYKAVLIPQAEFLSEEAANGLLKILEEPTPKTIFILITNSKEVMLPTIVSRCQALNFTAVARGEIYDYLVNNGANRDLAREITGVAYGRPAVALKFWREPESFVEYKQQVTELLKLLTSRNSDKFRILEQAFDKTATKDTYARSLEHLGALVRDLQLIQLDKAELVSQVFLQDKLTLLARNFIDAPMFLRKIEQAKSYIRKNLQPRLVMEDLLIT